MKKSRDTFAVWSLFGCLALFGGCGDADSDAGLSVFGDWKLSDNCVVVMDGSRGSLNCNESTVVYDAEADLDFDADLTYAFDVRLDEDRVELDGSLSVAWVDDRGRSNRRTVRISGAATRDSGRSASGEFSALAGEWRFSGTASRDGQSDSATGTVSVLGDSATITVDGDSETYAVTASSAGLDIDGTFLEKL